ncbi:probable polygalacturonase At3g15720 [Vitis riparia]|uniref:probable polygalacturonase At3g15720 n=1 Tax=Vitis riparia TaxID=96939 RepID=UPI00155A3CA0|nr:probable polygalacturonase At3g15720 [Vitis riparia]
MTTVSQMDLLPFFLMLCMATSGMSIMTNSLLSPSFNVVSYGAVGNGKTDDSKAFMKAWSAVCHGQSHDAHLIIPPKTFLLKPVKFSGPCKASRITVQVLGKLVASTNKRAFNGNYWLLFHKVKGLTLWGKGSIDGKGSAWWQQHDSDFRPAALKFYECPGMVLKGLTHLNSQKQHIVITKCHGALISKIKVIAPEDSPNTDGINIASSKNVRVQRSHISTGDDCIAISAGSSNIKIKGMTCAPSHGISIGALGDPGKPDESVEKVDVSDCTFKGPGIGVRIKTWQGGRGRVRNISYKNIEVQEVGTPIVIDQFYCPRGGCKNNSDAVRVSDVSYSGIRGTYTRDDAMSLLCSQNAACTNIVLDNINLRTMDPKKAAKVKCFNVKGRSQDVKPVVDCLSH